MGLASSASRAMENSDAAGNETSSDPFRVIDGIAPSTYLKDGGELSAQGSKKGQTFTIKR
jgi:hypothetical protein